MTEDPTFANLTGTRKDDTPETTGEPVDVRADDERAEADVRDKDGYRRDDGNVVNEGDDALRVNAAGDVVEDPNK